MIVIARDKHTLQHGAALFSIRRQTVSVGFQAGVEVSEAVMGGEGNAIDSGNENARRRLH
jgi:hypothetical protein